MTIIPVTLAAAGILGLIYIVLSVQVVLARQNSKILIGDGAGTDEALHIKVRCHGNFAEYVPIALILLGGCELAGGAHWLMVLLAVMLIAGRVAHPFGMSRPAPNAYRITGMSLTYLMLIVASLEALKLAL